MKFLKRIALIFMGVLFLLPGCSVERKQDKFVLSTFFAVGGSGDEAAYEKALKLTKDSGINLVEFTWLTDGNAIMAAVRACERLQLNNLVQHLGVYSGFADQILPSFTDPIGALTVKRFQDYKYNVGFYVWDEPHIEQFAQTRRIKDYFEANAPEKLAFSCVLPSYGCYTWDAGTYPDYVDEYIETVDPDILSMDYYPFMSGPQTLYYNGIWKDVGYFRQRSMDYDKPFWFYFQAVGDLSGYNPSFMTVEMTKAQMYGALCYGVKGLSYFASYGALVTPEGEKSENYDALTAVNSRVKDIGNFLYDKTSDAVYCTGLTPREEREYFLDNFSKADFKLDAKNDLMIGEFSDEHARYILLANPWYEKDDEVYGILNFEQSVRAVDFDTGEVTFGSEIPFTIAPGDAVLFTIGE